MSSDRTTPRAPRDHDARRHDHAEIDRLTDDVLPDLISRLAASGLGEIDVREDDWRIRLRRPAAAPAVPAIPAARTDRSSDRAADRADRTDRADRPDRLPRAAGGPDASPSPAPGPRRVVATSPAVGVFQPRQDLRPGTRVRAGDRLGAVNLLGVPQDVVAPDDGIVVTTLVEAGEGVEYGQDLIVIEPGSRGRPGPDDGAADPAGSPAVSES